MAVKVQDGSLLMSIAAKGDPNISWNSDVACILDVVPGFTAKCTLNYKPMFYLFKLGVLTKKEFPQ